MTSATAGQSGSVWFQNKISLASDLTISELLIVEIQEESGASFKITVSHNPTPYQFTIRIQSNVETLVSIRILNGMGQVMEGMSKVNVNSIVSMGGNLRSGAYMAKVIQGNERKMVKLVKLN